MLREYAIEPEALARHPLPLMVTSAFGPNTGRYMATVQKHNKWRQRVASAIRQIREEGGGNSLAIEKLLMWLEKQKNTAQQTLYIERPEVQFDGDLSWLENILKAHSITAYDGILTCSGEKNTQKLVDIHEEQDWWKARSSEHFNKTPEEYARVLGGTLRRSKNIMLLDPFFKPEGNHLKVFRALTAKIDSAIQPRIEVICLNCDYPKDSPAQKQDFIDKCERRLTGLVPLGVTLIVRRVNNLPTDRYHDRYLITDTLSVMSGYGFEGDDRDTRTTTISMLNLETAKNIQTWINNTANFDVNLIWSNT